MADETDKVWHQQNNLLRTASIKSPSGGQQGAITSSQRPRSCALRTFTLTYLREDCCKDRKLEQVLPLHAVHICSQNPTQL